MQRYEVGDEPKLGLVVKEVLAGGMGIVYILEFKGHPELKKALKSTASERMLSPETLQRFQRESLIWISLLPHPNIVKADTFEIEAGLPFLHLEYVAGGNLRQRLETGRVELPEILRMALEFCEGMNFLAESGGIVHRDIKPENVLLSESGVVKITDFGLASAYWESHTTGGLGVTAGSIEEGPELTQEGAILGTLPYMSPEQFVDFHNIGTKSDIYSFGVVLYEMLTARRPFDEQSPQAFARAHVHTTPQDPKGIDPQVPQAMNEITMRCLAKKPEERFADFAELSARLVDYCRRDGLEASIPRHYEIADLKEQLDIYDWNNRGVAFRQLGMHEKAVDCYDRGLAKVDSATDLDTVMKTPGVEQTKPSVVALTATLHTNKGAVLMRMGQLKEARQSFEDALRVDPADGAAYFRLAEIELHHGSTSKGLSLLEKSTECEPGNADLLGKLMRWSYQLGERERFEGAFKKFLALVSERGQTAFLVGIGCHYDDGLRAFDVALRCFEAALDMEPENPSAWYNKGVTLQRQGLESEALTCYDNALRSDQDHSFAHFGRGILVLKQGRLNEALSNLKRFLELDQQSPFADLVRTMVEGARLGHSLDSFLPMLSSPLAMRHMM